MIEITWDEKKCTSPQECRVCLDECPQGVFHVYPRNGRTPGKVTQDWAIAPLYLSLCTGCDICEELCPENALAVTAA